jgi:hypothetical protein
MDHYRQKEALRLLEWISTHETEWRDICGLNKDEISADRYIELMTMLKDQSFYQIIMVFILIP